MEINIFSPIKKLDKNYDKAIKEYIKRISPFSNINIKTYNNKTPIAFKNGSFRLLVVPGDNSLTSPDFAEYINKINISGFSCIEFVILDMVPDVILDMVPDVIQDVVSDKNFDTENVDTFNLSSFSLNPEVATTALCEQIYRAFTIQNNITYHK